MSMLALAGHSVLFQAAAIILGTFILEDAATVAAAMQVEDGSLSLWVALLSLYAGIVLGDLGLYGLGRLSARIPWVARHLPPHRQETIRAWISGRIFRVVLVSRFLPGLRLSNLHHMRVRRCQPATVHARRGRSHRLLDQPAFRGFVEIGTVPYGSSGRMALGRRGRIYCLHHPGGPRGCLRPAGRAPMSLDTALSSQPEQRDQVMRVADKRASPLSFFEFWPGWIFYTPVVMHWLMLGLRYGDFSLPTAANPNITTGGLCGESKLSILSQIGAEAQALVASACGIQARPDGAAAAEAAMGSDRATLSRGGQARYRLQRHRRQADPRPPRHGAVLAGFSTRRNRRSAALHPGTQRSRDLLRASPGSAPWPDHLADDQEAAHGGGRRPLHAASADPGR